MAKLFTEHHGINGKSLTRIQMIFPMDGFDLVVNFVSIFSGEVFDWFQDADSCTQAEVGFVHHFFVAAKRHHAASDFNVIGTQGGEFLCQYLFQSLEGFGNHFKRLFAHLIYLLFDYLLCAI